MIKKYSKIILLTLLLFFVFITTVNAKEVTLDELAQEVKEFEPNATYVYVIGEYAFTSTHILTTQDVMLAARSIEVSENSGSTNEDPIYNEMTIGYFECTYDEDWNINGLEYVTNLVGTTPAKEKYVINYIDHNADINKVEVNELVEKAYKTVTELANNDKFMVSMEEGKILVTILDAKMNSVEALKGTGLSKAAEELLNEEGVKTVTVGIAGTEAKVTVTAENLMDKLGELDELFAVLAGKEEATAKDLAEKKLELTVELEEGYTTDDEPVFTVTFAVNEVPVADLVETAYNAVADLADNDKFEVSLGEEEIIVTLLDAEMNSVDALKGTGLSEVAEDLLNEEGVKAVVLTIPGTTAKVEITAENLMEKAEELNEFFVALAGKEEATAKDLAEASLEMAVELEEGYITEDETTFTVTFNVKEVAVNDLVETAYNTATELANNDKFEVGLVENGLVVTLLDVEMNSVEALKGTGISEVAEELLNAEGVKTVVLTIPGTTAKVEITAENLMEKAEELNEFFIALAGKEEATAKDLAEASLEVIVELEKGYVAEGEKTFTVTFAIKEVAVNDLVEKANNAIVENTENDKFQVSVENDEVTVTILNGEMNSVEALKGMGLTEVAEDLLNEEGVKAVVLTIPGTTAKVEITAENLMEKAEELNEFFVALAEKENATAKDLEDKEFDVRIELEEGYVADVEPTFTVTFAKKEVVVVSELVNDMYETIENTTAASDKFTVAKTDDTITVTIVDTEMNSVYALGGTGISDAAENLLNAEGVKSVTLAIPNTTAKVELTAENIMDNLGLIDELFVALAGSEEATAADLAAKELSVSIGLEDGYATNNNTTFMITFA